MLHNWLIPSDLLKCFTAEFTKTEKLRNDLSVITICLANYTSEQGREQTYDLWFQCHFTWTPSYVSFLLATLICQKSIVVQQSTFLYSWQWHVAQHTQNALLCFHCNNGYSKAPQCYVIRTLPVLLNNYFQR